MSGSGAVSEEQALLARDLPDDPPEGFLPMPPRVGFPMIMGQFYGRMEDGMLVVAFLCSPRHMNNHGACHGGMLAAFADFTAYAVRLAANLPDISIPTASLSIEFLRPVRLGDWVEARTQMTKRGRKLIFSRVTATVGSDIVFTAAGIFVPGPEDKGGLEGLMGIVAAG
jgi:uncharacterized protein (TIGR00369 family)